MAVLVSMNIRPYVETLEGMNAALSHCPDIRLRSFMLEDYQGKNQPELLKELAAYRFFVAIGPESMRFLWNNFPKDSGNRIFTMVLNPEKVVTEGQTACGIPLNIPFSVQAGIAARTLPDLKQIGVMYDPVHNASFFQEARSLAASLGLNLVPLEVSSRQQIPHILESHWEKINALWLIPDQTVVSETLIRYIIKESLSNNVAAIGYNRFFYESGAVLSFILDYKEIGRQTGDLACRMMKGDVCETRVPAFRVWVNQRAAKAVGLTVQIHQDMPVEEGP